MKFVRESLLIVRRLPFTIAIVLLLVFMALVTETHVKPLTLDWLNVLGFGAHDLWYLRLERLFTSAVVTQGGRGFWGALGMLAFSVGLAEWLAGTWKTLLTFIGIHLLTLVVEALLIGLAQPFNNGQVLALFWVRDVGPSAGYFGCLGLACASISPPWRWLSAGVIMAFLVGAFILPTSGNEPDLTSLSANFAHLLAFPMGFASASLKLTRKPTPEQR
jgi:hypothetical protein